MSAYVLTPENIQLLTQATDAALRMNQRYPGSYNLAPRTIELLGKYAGDRHSIYRALYITNIKAVNGRYGENEKTLPKYTPVPEMDIDELRLDTHKIRKACGMYGCYMYQIAEDPIYNTDIYHAFADIYKLLCMIYFSKSHGWDGETQEYYA